MSIIVNINMQIQVIEVEKKRGKKERKGRKMEVVGTCKQADIKQNG